jgi:MFS family permease
MPTILRALTRFRLTRPHAASNQTLVVLGLALAPVVALGFSRFAYALLLPPMREDLGWTYTAAGGMNTANAIGYIVGAATAALWAWRLGTRRAFIAMLVVSALALTATAATSDYVALMALRVIGGVSTAVSFVVGSSLAARMRGSLLPLYFAGPAIGAYHVDRGRHVLRARARRRDRRLRRVEPARQAL